MGRGRAGLGMMRWTHVKLSVELINFDEIISKAETPTDRSIWMKRKALVEKLKANPPTYIIQGKKASRRKVVVPEPEPESEKSAT